MKDTGEEKSSDFPAAALTVYLTTCVGSLLSVALFGCNFSIVKTLAVIAFTRFKNQTLCDPHRPSQRGSNENTNGLLRQYFPKRSSFKDITDERLAEVARLINDRPGKRLGFKPHAKVLNEHFPQSLNVL